MFALWSGAYNGESGRLQTRVVPELVLEGTLDLEGDLKGVPALLPDGVLLGESLVLLLPDGVLLGQSLVLCDFCNLCLLEPSCDSSKM